MTKLSYLLKYVILVGFIFYPITSSGLEMVKIEAGEYRPLYLSDTSPIIKVKRFWLDVFPVTNKQFYQYIQTHPKWAKQNIPSIFSEAQYLQHWQKNEALTLDNPSLYSPLESQLNSPVVLVSWFAAQAYCHDQGKALPSVAQWEYAGSASEHKINGSDDDGYNQQILQWYSKPTTQQLAPIGQRPANYWGVQDMHGLIWEWTEDFNNSLVTGESRGDSSLDSNLFCGSGAAGAADPSDYAAFMRYAYRTSLKATFTQLNLGFRCASDKEIIK